MQRLLGELAHETTPLPLNLMSWPGLPGADALRGAGVRRRAAEEGGDEGGRGGDEGGADFEPSTGPRS